MQPEVLTPEAHFSCQLYTIRKPELVSGITGVVTTLLERVKKTPPLNEVYPVYMTESMIGDPRASELEKFLADSAWVILNAQGYNMDGLETYVSEFWAQEHHKYSGMEQHVHPYGVVLSGFFFLQTPENGCMVELHDPRPGKVVASLPMRDPTKITDANNSVFIKPEPGLLVFTNAWLPHSFTRNASDTPVSFIHFNLSVRPSPRSVGPIVV